MTAAVRKQYFCTACDVRTDENAARCPGCHKWNTLKEGSPDTMSTNVVRMKDIDSECTVKVPTGLPELDAALDGGVVPGQVILLGGAPGAGKSTLVLTVAGAMTKRGVLRADTGKVNRRKKNKVLLVSSEEDIEKIRARSIRIKAGEDILICHNKEIGEIEADFATYQPEFGIVDSLQSMTGNPLENLTRLYEYAHATSTTMFVLCQVNAEGGIAGLTALEHKGDTTLMLERDRKDSDARTLRPLKNRHGSEDHVGLFDMTSEGLISFDPTASLNMGKMKPGQAYAIATVAGKVFPIEVQALARLSERPRVSVLGYSAQRVETMLAVLVKHCGIDCLDQDIYVQIVGGRNFTDTAIDAAVAMAIASTIKNVALPAKTAYVGEVDLLGQVKIIGRGAQRKEIAERHGFKLRIADTLSDMIDF